MLRENKIAFIICSNNEIYYDECVWYINQLFVPDGCEIDILCVTEAESMAQGYNAAMKESDAKYKVYLHQDVFIYNRYFIENVLEIFHSDHNIGMLGVIGGKDLSKDAEIWNTWNLGETYACNYDIGGWVHGKQDRAHKWMEADAIDGMLMVTQYDIEWREDLTLGWDFYDISQSIEFTRRGYKVVIPFQKDCWCMHDCGNCNLINYDNARKKIMEEYKELFPIEYEPLYDPEIFNKQRDFFGSLKGLFEQGRLEEALQIRDAIRNSKLPIINSDLQNMVNLLDIYGSEKRREEGTESFFTNVYTWEDAIDKYTRIKFITRHAENGTNDEAVEELILLMKSKKISREAVIIISEHSAVKSDKAINRLFYKTWTLSS